MSYSVAGLAKMLGVTPGRLRTWERRYGIPRPARTESGQRRYDNDDLALARRMVAFLDAGYRAADAANAALAAEPDPVPLKAQPRHPALADLLSETARFGIQSHEIIRRTCDEQGWESTLQTLVFPCLVEIGDRWHAGTITPGQEHFLSEVIREEIIHAIGQLPPPRNGAPLVLLACPEDERHDIGLLALRLLLRQRGLRVLYLGGDVPTESLVQAVRDVRPAAVVAGAAGGSGAASLGPATHALAQARIAARVFVGGPGIRSDDALPATVLPGDLGAAATLLAEATRTG